MRELLERLEGTPADELVTAIAFVAGQGVVLDEDELRGAARRSLQLLAAGGDPRRELELHGRAVTSLAADLDGPAARAALAAGLATVRDGAEGLPAVGEATRALLADPDLAWQAFACATLAEQLADD
jgi:hypothetical protein